MVPPELVDCLLGSPDSSFQENRTTHLVHHLCHLLMVRRHPVDSSVRRMVQASWAALTIRQMVANPAFCDDLRLAIGRLNNGTAGLNKKLCLAQAYLILSGYQDWWSKSPDLHYPGIPIFLNPDPQVGDFVYLCSVSTKELAYVEMLRTKYQGRLDTYMVRLLAAMFIWRQHNMPDRDQAELDFEATPHPHSRPRPPPGQSPSLTLASCDFA